MIYYASCGAFYDKNYSMKERFGTDDTQKIIYISIKMHVHI